MAPRRVGDTLSMMSATMLRWIALLGLGAAAAVALPRIKSELRSRFYQIARQAAQEELSDDALNLWRQRQRLATADTADFVNKRMGSTKFFVNRFELLDHALQQVTVKGLYCEFGVWKGESINYIAGRVKDKIHGFDSFEGLPEDWITAREKGTFAVEKLPLVPANVELHKGWFSKSLPGFSQAHPGPLAFAHLDADLYSSTRDVFQALRDRIVPVTIVVFDEYFNYPGWRDGEFKALEEFASETAAFEYLGYVNSGQQVAIKITARK